MPNNIVKTKRDKKLWNKAKDIVQKEYGKSEDSGDDFWKLVNGIYQRMNKALIFLPVTSIIRLQKSTTEDLPPGGEWRTLKGGHRIYIYDGKIIAGQVPGLGNKSKKMSKPSMESHQKKLDLHRSGAAYEKASHEVITKAPKTPKPKEPAANKTPFHYTTANGFEQAKNAKKVDIHPELATFIHKNKFGQYAVTEATSGKAISSASDMPEEAIEEAKENVKKHGIDKIKNLISQFITNTGLSPKYAAASDGSVYDHTKDKNVYSGNESELNDKPTKPSKAKKAAPTPSPADDEDNEYDDDYNSQKGQKDRDQFIYADEDVEDDYNVAVFHGTDVAGRKGILKNGFRIRGLDDDLGTCAYFKSPKFDSQELRQDRKTHDIVKEFSGGVILRCKIPKAKLLDCSQGRPKDLEDLMTQVHPGISRTKRFTNAMSYMTGKPISGFEEACEEYRDLPMEKQWGHPDDIDNEDFEELSDKTTAYEVYCKKHGYNAVVDILKSYQFEGIQIGVYDPTIIQIHDVGKRTDYEPGTGRLRLHKALLKAISSNKKALPYCLVKHEFDKDGNLMMHVLTHTNGDRKKAGDKVKKSLPIKSEVKENVAAEVKAVKDYVKLIANIKKYGGSDKLVEVIEEIMADEKNHEANLKQVLKFLQGRKDALSEDKLEKSLNLEKKYPGGRWVTMHGHHVYVKKDGTPAKETPLPDSAKGDSTAIPPEGKTVYKKLLKKPESGKTESKKADSKKADSKKASPASVAKNMKKVMAENPDGVSINPDGTKAELKDGYMVALTDNDITGQKVEKAIADLQKYAATHNIADMFFGYWKDAHTGKEFLDISVNVKDKKKAIALAKKHDQKAIYGVKEQDVIDTKEFDAKTGAYKEEKPKKVPKEKPKAKKAPTDTFKPSTNKRWWVNEEKYNALKEAAQKEIPFPVTVKRATQKTMAAGGGSVHIIPKKRKKGAEDTADQYRWTPEEFKHIRSFINRHKLSPSHSAEDLHSSLMYKGSDRGHMNYANGAWFLYHAEDPNGGKPQTVKKSLEHQYPPKPAKPAKRVKPKLPPKPPKTTAPKPIHHGKSKLHKSYTIHGAGKGDAVLLKSLGASYDLDSNAWMIDLDLHSPQFKGLADFARKANVTIKEG